MPKKDVNGSILGMLSTAGSTTRPAREAGGVVADSPAVPKPEAPAAEVVEPVAAPAPTPEPEPAADTGEPVAVADIAEPEAPKQQRQICLAGKASDTPAAPRTLRLRPGTATDLRDAWLEAKRDDVLLTAQDFASDLLEEMLKLRRRRTRAAS